MSTVKGTVIKMKTLILSCNTGQGHNSCAGALRDFWQQQGDVCEIADALSFLSEGTSRFTCDGFHWVYRYAPWLFRQGYSYAERNPDLFRRGSPVYRILTSGSGRMYEYIRQGGYDSVICTHVFTALMLTAMLEKYPMELATGFVATDYTCSPSGKESRLQRYFIPHEGLAGDFECANIPEETLRYSGIPIRPVFYDAIPKEKAKEALGIAPRRKHLIMMCGSMGCGPIPYMARRIAKHMGETTELTVICGTNRPLKNKMERMFAENPRVHVTGYVQDMSLLMDSADLYLTKPGGISVTEAAVKHLPMVLIDVVSGCEIYNKLYYLRCGGARVGANAKETADLCLEVLANDAILTRMRHRLAAVAKPHAAESIYSEMKSLTENLSHEDCIPCG